MPDLATIDAQIREHVASLALLQEQKETALALAPDERVADAIHMTTCHASHIDQCGYEYESWNNPGTSRKRYQKQAMKLLEVVDEHNAIKVLGALRGW